MSSSSARAAVTTRSWAWLPDRARRVGDSRSSFTDGKFRYGLAFMADPCMRFGLFGQFTHSVRLPRWATRLLPNRHDGPRIFGAGSSSRSSEPGTLHGA